MSHSQSKSSAERDAFWQMVKGVNRARRARQAPKYSTHTFVWFDGKNSNFSPEQIKQRDRASMDASADAEGSKARFKEARENGRSLVQQVTADVAAGTENYRCCLL